MIQARDPATPPPSVPHLIGQFTAVNDGAKTLNCDHGGMSAGVSYCMSLHIQLLYSEVQLVVCVVYMARA